MPHQIQRWSDPSLEEELSKIDENTIAFARDTLEQEGSLSQNSFTLYSQRIASWFQVLALKFSPYQHGLKNNVDLNDRKKRLKHKATLLEKKLQNTSFNSSHLKLLQNAHHTLAFSESLTIAAAFQIFGGSLITTIFIFLSFWIVFYFLPKGILELFSKISTKTQKTLAATMCFILLTGVFIFLGIQRANFSSALGEGLQTLPTIGFVILNWVFLSVSIYIVSRKARYILSDKEIKLINDYEKLQKTLGFLSGQQKEQSIQEGEHYQLRSYLQVRFNEALHKFKHEIITSHNGVIPSSFTQKTVPLEFDHE